MSRISGRSSASRIVVFLLSVLSLQAPAVAQNSYSEQTVAFGEDEFFPSARGRIIKDIQGDRITQMERIYETIISWDSLNPPKGFEVRFDAGDSYASLAFSAYVREGDSKTTKSGPILYFYINDPVRIMGSPVVGNIFLQPEKVDDFFGYPVYLNTNNEVTVISKTKAPPFVPVTREEYLEELITIETGKQNKEDGHQQKSDSEVILAEMEKSYRELLKMDTEAAAEFRIEIQNFRADMAKDQDAGAPADLLALLKAELAKLSPAERKQPAYYAVGAFERYSNLSGLVPESGKDSGTALVRLAPAYAGMANSKNDINLLVISWNVGADNANSDKPRLFHGDARGFMLADYYMARLYHQRKIWSDIVSLVF